MVKEMGIELKMNGKGKEIKLKINRKGKGNRTQNEW